MPPKNKRATVREPKPPEEDEEYLDASDVEDESDGDSEEYEGEEGEHLVPEEDVEEGDDSEDDEDDEGDEGEIDEKEEAELRRLIAEAAKDAEEENEEEDDEDEDGDDEFDSDEDDGDEEEEDEGVGGDDGSEEVDEEDDPLEAEAREEAAREAAYTTATGDADHNSDSSDDERPNRNTVGNVPLKWYEDEEHIGYDKEGKKLVKAKKKDQLEAFLNRTDNKKDYRTIYDEYNDEEVVLSKDELNMIRRIRKGHFPDVNINPYEEYVDWMEYEDKGHPLSSAPEPKRRFIPSKHEAKKVVKLVRAIRRGWIKFDQEKKAEKPLYMMWDDDNQVAEKTAIGLSYIPAPKPKLPGHEESYNPSEEYLPTEEERQAYAMMDEEEQPKFVPQAFEAMRKVPAFKNFIRDRFERCLDLYLCPRTRKKRINIDPETLLPKLPKPRDLQPFPLMQCVLFLGHTDKVRSVSADPSGQWLASSSSDRTIRLWEVRTGRCERVWTLDAAVECVAWCPNPAVRVIAAASGNRVVLLDAGVGPPEALEATKAALALSPAAAKKAEGEEPTMAAWAALRDCEGGQGLQVGQRFRVQKVTWHQRGDYLASTAPAGGSLAVLVHQLSKQATQNPFKKPKGKVHGVLFHPSKPFFFQATQNHVRVYNLAKQSLAKKLVTGVQSITSMAVHPGGDNLIVGSVDRKMAWFDMDLSTKPYKTITSHEQAVQGVAFHSGYPLFATGSDDGSVHVFHGMVYSDLLQNPLIVPVKILRGHKIVDHQGVLDVTFHPKQPWLFTAGADNTIRLFCD